MNSHYEIKGSNLIIYVPKDLDHHVAKEIQQDVDSMIDAYGIRQVIFDFKETEFMDSSGIGVLLGRCRKMHFLNGKVKASNLQNHRVRKIFSMAGLYQLLEVEEA